MPLVLEIHTEGRNSPSKFDNLVIPEHDIKAGIAGIFTEISKDNECNYEDNKLMSCIKEYYVDFEASSIVEEVVAEEEEEEAPPRKWWVRMGWKVQGSEGY